MQLLQDPIIFIFISILFDSIYFIIFPFHFSFFMLFYSIMEQLLPYPILDIFLSYFSDSHRPNGFFKSDRCTKCEGVGGD